MTPIWIQGRYEIPTRGVRQVQYTYKGNEVSSRHLQRYEVGSRYVTLQGVRGGYKTSTMSTQQV